MGLKPIREEPCPYCGKEQFNNVYDRIHHINECKYTLPKAA